MPSFEFAGESLEVILLATSILLVVSVMTSRISGALGLPALLLFIGIGMLAGSDGPGGIEFTNYKLTYAIGSVTLAFILFDGGFRTSWSSVRPIIGLGVSLSTVGVLVTALLAALFCRFAFAMDWIASFLVGAIVSSTDAAAVFSVLRSSGVILKGRVKQILEFEAGSNDPASILLTIAFLTMATSPETTAASFAILFVKQVVLGLVGGALGGRGASWLINHLRLEYEGLYSVFVIGWVIFVFSLTAYVGGSGFLAVYVAGLVLGNSEILHKGSLLRFYDGIAWISQIALFLVLGLLVFPRHLPGVWREGVLLALFLTFIARPLSVFIGMPGKSFAPNERLFISWVGLRGAAPIVLATLPWSADFPQAEFIFNLVFFVVLTSVVLQGTSIPFVARRLDVVEPLPQELHEMQMGVLPAEFVSIRIHVASDAPAAGKRLVELRLPSGVLFTSLERGGRFIVPRGESIIESGDRISGLARQSNFEELYSTFGPGSINRG